MPPVRRFSFWTAPSLTGGVTGVNPDAPAAEPLVIRAQRLFDGKSDGTVSPGVVVVKDGKIIGVGPAAPIPPDARIIDLGDATILPGFIDCHTHLTMEMTDDWKADELDRFKKTIPEQTLDASVFARRTLRAGFTTVRDCGASDLIDVGLRNAIANGKVDGPRMLVSVNAIIASGGHGDYSAGYRPDIYGEPGVDKGIADGPDAMRRAVRIAVKYGADVIKVCASGGVLSLTGNVDSPQMTQAELDAIVDEAHALGRKTAAHCHGAEAAKRAIRAGIDSIEHGTFLDDEGLEMMKARGTYLVPTLMALKGLQERFAKSAFLPPQVKAKAEAAARCRDAMFRRALALGVPMAFGTDAGVYTHGRNAEEFALLVELGMKPVDALKAATSVAAELLGISESVGTLEIGRVADVVASFHDPTQNLSGSRRISFLMKAGRVFSQSSNA